MRGAYDHQMTREDVLALLVALGLEVFVCGCGGRCARCACLATIATAAVVHRFSHEEIQMLHAGLKGS
jgi:hypothetical protein